MTTRHPSQWWDRSWNPVTGCTPAGAGCDHCHALQRMRRHLPALRGAGNALVPETQVLCHPERLDIPLKRRTPAVWLVSMLGDVFHEQVPREFILDVFGTVDACQHHKFCLLTKRPERAAEMLRCWTSNAWPHLTVMASVWDQPSAEAACAALSQLRGVRWGLHVEPMLGPIDMRQTECNRLTCPSQPSWVVCGAEQGPGARPFDLDWARSLRDQCRAAGVPFWFKSGPRRSEPPTDLLVRETAVIAEQSYDVSCDVDRETLAATMDHVDALQAGIVELIEQRDKLSEQVWDLAGLLECARAGESAALEDAAEWREDASASGVLCVDLEHEMERRESLLLASHQEACAELAELQRRVGTVRAEFERLSAAADKTPLVYGAIGALGNALHILTAPHREGSE